MKPTQSLTQNISTWKYCNKIQHILCFVLTRSGTSSGSGNMGLRGSRSNGVALLPARRCQATTAPECCQNPPNSLLTAPVCCAPLEMYLWWTTAKIMSWERATHTQFKTFQKYNNQSKSVFTRPIQEPNQNGGKPPNLATPRDRFILCTHCYSKITFGFE